MSAAINVNGSPAMVAVNRKQLAAAVALAGKVVEHRKSMPILGNVSLVAGADGLTLCATDLEQWLAVELAADVEPMARGRAVTVGAKQLGALLRSLTAESVTLWLEPTLLTLGAGAGVARLAGAPIEEFPQAPSAPELSASGASAEFALALGRVAFAASEDETRYNLNGVFLERRDGSLQLVTTDGHRMAWATLAAGGDPFAGAKRQEAIVRLAALPALAALLKRGPRVEFGIGERDAAFKVGNATLLSRLIEGEYPNYRQVLPKGGEGYRIDADALAGALRQVLPFASEKSQSVKLTFAEGECIVLASNPDTGDAEARCACSFAAGELVRGFNANYLLDALAPFAGERELELLHGSALIYGEGPMRLSAHGSEHASIVMPMKL